jgi:heavy metal sensor kinase
VSRLPIRLRLTLVFTLVMALVLAGFGAFVYLRLKSSLDEQLDESLAVRADALASLVQSGAAPSSSLGPVGEDEFAQVLGPDGTLLGATPSFTSPLLVPDTLARARAGPVVVDRIRVAGIDGGEARIRAIPVESGGETRVALVGASLEDRDDALDGLLTQLLIGGPIALLLASLAGYALAAGALRPVERMRERAAAISAETPGERLPLPPARDELYRLGETLNAMLERLEAGVARERRFVAEASHELRTPLALLKAELELALRRPRPAPELESALRSAADEADRLALLAEDLLVLARADEGELALRRSEIHARDLLETVARRFSPRAEPSGRTLSVSTPQDPLVSGDRLRLEQALGNLVDNALRHGKGTIRLEAKAENGTVALRVSDEGAGFSPQLLPVAFERFSRTDEARARGSTGLGLAIVDAIARAHGGHASAANRPGGGAEITIALPQPPVRA